MPNAIELRQEAGQWVNEARAMLERVEGEKRGFDEAEHVGREVVRGDSALTRRLIHGAHAVERQEEPVVAVEVLHDDDLPVRRGDSQADGPRAVVEGEPHGLRLLDIDSVRQFRDPVRTPECRKDMAWPNAAFHQDFTYLRGVADECAVDVDKTTTRL